MRKTAPIALTNGWEFHHHIPSSFFGSFVALSAILALSAKIKKRENRGDGYEDNKKCPLWESNPGPSAYKAGALPTELKRLTNRKTGLPYQSHFTPNKHRNSLLPEERSHSLGNHRRELLVYHIHTLVVPVSVIAEPTRHSPHAHPDPL